MSVSAQVNDLCDPVGTMTTEIQPTRIAEFFKQMLPWAHGHQLKAISKFVLAIIDKQTGCEAELRVLTDCKTRICSSGLQPLKLVNPYILLKTWRSLLVIQSSCKSFISSRLLGPFNSRGSP